ncbi:MAG: dTDP-4-dehydrorhamnose reductase [Gammaproteobacteria bacterium]|nr:dTDP-4-dehydrorhamnose reductase [Gammaproteobacteria bacterium]
MKILLFGKNGQVGWELNRSLQPLGEIIALDIEDADFSKPESLRQVIQDIKPNIIVNAVAYTAVDKAEEEEALALNINGVAPGVLAEEALKLNALLIHYSTDYVFDGTKSTPYVETDSPHPINAYGRTKLAGEVAIQVTGCDYLILRTSWVYASRGHNFLLSILKLAKERDELSIVADQAGAPTWARTIADVSGHVLHKAQSDRRMGKFKSNVYNLTSSGQATWFDFAVCIVDMARAYKTDSEISVREIHPISANEYVTAASRPANSCLQVSKLENDFNITMPNWKQACALCMEETQQ